MISIGPINLDTSTSGIQGNSNGNLFSSLFSGVTGSGDGDQDTGSTGQAGGLTSVAQGGGQGNLRTQTIQGQGLEILANTLGIPVPSGAAATVVIDPNLANLREVNQGMEILSRYLGERADQGRDLDPNSQIDKRFPTGNVSNYQGRDMPFLEPSEIQDFAYHYGMSETEARNYVGTNELADLNARQRFPNLADNPVAIETIGQSVNAQLNPAISFAQIENWRAEAQDIASDPTAQEIGFAGVLQRNYSNLFAQQDKAIGEALSEANVGTGTAQQRAAAFSKAFQEFRTSEEGKDLPRGEQMERFVEQYVRANSSGADPTKVLRDMQEGSRDNLVDSARGYMGR